MDRDGFPCPCSSEGCSNPSGRVAFNAVSVRSHYFHTMMRLRHDDVGSPSHVTFDDADHHHKTASAAALLYPYYNPCHQQLQAGGTMDSSGNNSVDSGFQDLSPTGEEPSAAVAT